MTRRRWVPALHRLLQLVPLLALLAACATVNTPSRVLDTHDVVAIQQLLARYTLLADVDKSHAGEGMREIFTNDAMFQVPAIDLYVKGIDNIVVFFRERPGGDHHINTNLVVEGAGDRAKARSYVHIIKAEKGVQSLVFGYYEDELVKTAEGWRIQHRNTVLLDFPFENSAP